MGGDVEGLDAVAAELYAGSPDDFIAARTAAVKQARSSGDKPLATAIGGLRKPTRTAWLVNLLSRGAADDLDGLLELGAALRAAQESLSGDDLRRLSGERRRAVDALAARAVELGRAEGYAASDTVRQEVSQTLQAGLADPDLGDQIRRGTVAAASTSGGFGPFSLGEATATAPVRKAEPKPARGARAGSDDLRARRESKARDAARSEAEDRAAAADRAEASVAEAQEAAEAATREADAAADRADELRAELKAAEDAEKQARRAARQARKAAEDAGRARDAARQSADEAAARLADLEGG